jgi:ABC-type transport system involved in cytochrome c biogenesis permease subunit
MMRSTEHFVSMRSSWLKRGAAVFCAALSVGCLTLNAAESNATTSASFERLPPDLVEAFRGIPMQDGGRVKPFDTVARFKLLRIHGKRTLRLGEGRSGEKVSASEWMIQSMLYPERVQDLPLFVVDNDEVVVAIGVEAHAKKRSRFSYNEIVAARAKLYELSQEYRAIEAKLRDPDQSGIVNLAQNISDFEFLMHTLDFARNTFTLSPETLPGVVDVETDVSVADFLNALPKVRVSLFEQNASGNHEDNPAIQEITEIVTRLTFYAGAGAALYTAPPEDPEQTEWLSPGALIDASMRAEAMSPHAYAHLKALEALVAAGKDETALTAAATTLRTLVRGQARVRGESKHLDLETKLYDGNYFFQSLLWYMIAFLVVAFSWMGKTNKDASRRARLVSLVLKLTPLAIATISLIVGITLRCIIRGRPPVTNLYETVLFITVVAFLIALLVEWIVKDRIALAMAPILGTMGMFLANKYEMKEAVDTMPSLVAVLDTNFWLSTHVTCVTIGYAAGLLAGALGHVYVFGKVLGIKKRDPDVYASISRMTYGVVCFGLLFAYVGTMLGGVWANYSWGRFWGWDPKENGALMIVLWMLVILHARMGGYIREFGLAICSIFCAAIVAFSWWGVNLLGVGLHSYGFTSGIARTLITYWSIEAVVILIGFAWYLKHKSD